VELTSGNKILLAYTPTLGYLDTKTSYDVVTPNFRDILRRGGIINNPCNMQRTVVDLSGHSNAAVRRPLGGTTYEQRDGPVLGWFVDSGFQSWRDVAPGNSGNSALASTARFRCLKNIDTTPFAFGEDIAELRKTLAYIRNPLGALRNVAKSFNREVKKRAKSKKTGKSGPAYEKVVSDTWLEYQFAASPLMRSVVNAWDAATYKPKLPPVRKIARGKEEITNHDSLYGTVSTNTLHRAVKYTTLARAGVMYTVANPLDSVQNRLGLRPKDIPHVAWQIVPLSFMIDRVIDVSGAIKGIINLSDPDVTILAAWDTYSVISTTTLKFVSSTQWVPLGDLGAMTIRRKTYYRGTWSPSYRDAIPPPTLGGLVDSATKILDLLALTRSFLDVFSRPRR
jgi:hypothetical protein